jgi:DNA-3-methyladenine glycosylase
MMVRPIRQTQGKQAHHKVLGKRFLERRAYEVAPDLLGKFLVRRMNGKEVALMITEAEAYDGFADRASHAYRGKTSRTTVMFGPAGRWYVYFTYGAHWMVNMVTGPKDYPSAVLIRGGKNDNITLKGPALLTRYLKIDKQFNTLPTSKTSGLWLEDRGVVVTKKEIKKTARIGIHSAGPFWIAKKWRFVLA